jgi:hypothetical protein
MTTRFLFSVDALQLHHHQVVPPRCTHLL